MGMKILQEAGELCLDPRDMCQKNFWLGLSDVPDIQVSCLLQYAQCVFVSKLTNFGLSSDRSSLWIKSY